MTAEAPAQALHRMWATVAPAWREHAGYADSRGADVAAAMLAATQPKPGERVLELACGPGGLGLAAAALVDPGGEVVMSDVVAEMTSIAASRAAERGLTNVRTCDLDLDRIDQPSSSYDVVLCREGFMFAFNPTQAAAEIHRVLRPGGRVSLAVWGPRERNPWLGLVFDAVSAQIGQPVPPPGMPGPFSLDDRQRLASLLVEAGFADVTVTELPTPQSNASFDAWWTRTSSLAGPLAAKLAAMPPQAQQALRSRLQEAVRPYETSEGLEFPGLTLLASAHR
jgi:SAM-dependent methyltransferase